MLTAAKINLFMIELSGTLLKGWRSQNDVVRQLFLSTIFDESLKKWTSGPFPF